MSGRFEYRGKMYKSKKFPVLEYIFDKYNPNRDGNLSIAFTLKDISDGYKACGIDEPASISNTILDLTRKGGDVSSRLPESIYSLGYDLEKRTGKDSEGKSLAGEFIPVGIGGSVQSWLHWPENMEVMTISSEGVPQAVRNLLRRDEGALFSVIDYTDLFSFIFKLPAKSITRIQNPMKWQPNEIDGCYIMAKPDEENVYPVEAKALATRDDINLVQMRGGVRTISGKLENLHPGRYRIVPLAVQGIRGGMQIAIFQAVDAASGQTYTPVLVRAVKVIFEPPIANWT